MIHYLDKLYHRLFNEIDKPFIPILRILLVLISVKEVLSIRSKQAGYLRLPQAFYKHDVVTDFTFYIEQHYFDLFYAFILLLAFCSVIGLFTRISLAIYSVCLFIIYYLENSFGIYNHEAGLTTQLLFILSVAPGIQNWSLDKFFKTRQINLKVTPYNNWSVRLILLLLVLGYLTAGISKLRYGGVEWLNGKTLQYYLSGNASYKSNSPQKFTLDQNISTWRKEGALQAYTYGNFQSNSKLVALGQSVSNSTVLTILLSVGTIILELGAVFILFSPIYRNYFLIGAIIFHFSIRLFMGLGFLDYQVICFSLIDWSYFKNRFFSS